MLVQTNSKTGFINIYLPETTIIHATLTDADAYAAKNFQGKIRVCLPVEIQQAPDVSPDVPNMLAIAARYKKLRGIL
jgi:hypothetical protein